MTPAESLAITRFVRAACPQQKFEEYTADAWHELLADLRFVDVREAVRNLGRRQPFIGPADVRDEVRRVRAERIRALPTSALEPADVDPDDVDAYQAARRRLVEAAADGELTVDAPTVNVLGQARVVAAIEGRAGLPDDVRNVFAQAEQAARKRRAETLRVATEAKARKQARVEAARAELARHNSDGADTAAAEG
jgi:hypothetical protein